MDMNHGIMVKTESTSSDENWLCYHDLAELPQHELFICRNIKNSLFFVCLDFCIEWLHLLCHPRGAAGRYLYMYAVNDAYQLSLCEMHVYPARRK